MKGRIHQVGLVLVCSWLAGCGTPGAPRPPSLRLPETVRDLAATRQGSTIRLTWTEPARTTDGENIRALGATLVCMGLNDFPMTHCDEMVADLTVQQYASCKPEIGKPVTCSVTLDRTVQEQNPEGMATYAIEVLNANGRSAGLSNQARVLTALTPPAPTNGRATLEADAIRVSAVSEPYRPPAEADLRFRAFRVAENGRDEVDIGNYEMQVCAGACQMTFVDKSFAWEKTYIYHVVGVLTVHLPDGTNVDVQGDPSADIKVFAHDVFPPAAPSGVQAVASGVGQQPFVDMTWAPNTEPDLAGYNVYRHEEGQEPVKINSDLVKTPSYRDAAAERGKTYVYSVTAVDLRGNESSKSQEASETVH